CSCGLMPPHVWIGYGFVGYGIRGNSSQSYTGRMTRGASRTYKHNTMQSVVHAHIFRTRAIHDTKQLKGLKRSTGAATVEVIRSLRQPFHMLAAKMWLRCGLQHLRNCSPTL